jgi:YfiH family protein
VDVEYAPGFAGFGIRAFTTTRAAGDFGWHSAEPTRDVFGRWETLRGFVGVPRLVVAHQVHGTVIHHHEPGWEGLLRATDGDGHLSLDRGTAMAVSLADCVPVFIGHPSGAASIVHSGWRGTAGDIAGRSVDLLTASGCDAADLVAHCGPAICGSCYIVGADVYGELTGEAVSGPIAVDLRALIAGSLRRRGVRDVTVSGWCTRCHHDRWFSHRCGDAGRQVGVLAG